MGVWQSDEDFPIAGGRSTPAPRDERSDAEKTAQAAHQAGEKQRLDDEYHRMFAEGDRDGLSRAFAYAYMDEALQAQLGACLRQLGAEQNRGGGWVW